MSLTEYCNKFGYTVDELISERINDLKRIEDKLKGTNYTLQDILPILFKNNNNNK